MSDAITARLTEAREAILGRIRAALPGAISSVDASYASIHREYQRKGTLAPEKRMELFLDRLLEYDTEVIELDSADEIADAVAEVLQKAGEDRVLVPQEFPIAWIPSHIHPQFDDSLSAEEINSAQAVITTCEAAIAATGTILLVHGGAQGRRIATLLPDHHICIVRRSQIYETVSEAFAVLNPHEQSPVTSISGPSATSDIEMTRIRGVHGPRRLTVLLYGSSWSVR